MAGIHSFIPQMRVWRQSLPGYSVQQGGAEGIVTDEQGDVYSSFKLEQDLGRKTAGDIKPWLTAI